jgi:hypothetical protein
LCAGAIVLAVCGGDDVRAQDKYAVQVPDGLSFSEFRGYEDWAVVSIAQTDEMLKAIVANPTMIEAYRSGIPENGKPFPDGSKVAKLHWSPRKSAESPSDVNVPDTFKVLGFMVKDAKRFPDSGGWGYALFDYDAASDAFTPNGSGTACGRACHRAVAARDFIFHSYEKR